MNYSRNFSIFFIVSLDNQKFGLTHLTDEMAKRFEDFLSCRRQRVKIGEASSK